MKLNWKKWLVWVISPVAVGLYLTFALVISNFNYYLIANRDSEGSGLLDVMLTAHHKSIDYRLKMRGPRPVSPDLALLTVDERAVATIGRWPWPREVMAKAFDEAAKYGAKILAMDIIFSEPSNNPAREIYDSLKETRKLSPDIDLAMKAKVETMDGDRALAAAIQRHSNIVVSGAFSDDPLKATWPPETDFCRDMVFKRTPQAKVWDREEVLISVTDPLQPSIPPTLRKFFELVMQQREETVRQRLGKGRDRNEEVRIENEVHVDLHQACDTILDDFAENIEEIWSSEVLAHENPKDFAFKTYAEWLDNFRANSFANGVPYVDGWTTNTAQISEFNKHTGYFSAKLDSDGTIRSSRLLMVSGASYFAALPLKAYLVAKNYNVSPTLKFNAKSGTKEIAELNITDNETGENVSSIPVDGQGQLMINYAGPQKMYPYLSFSDLLSASPDANIEQQVFDKKEGKWITTQRKVKKSEFIKNKIFLVGATATGIYDLRVTPFEKNFPGAETHLNVIDNLVQKQFLRTVNDEPVYMPFVLLSIGLLLSFVLAFLGALSGLLITGSFLCAIFFIDKFYLFDQGLVTAVVWPLTLVTALYVTLTFYRYLTEERGKKELRQTFQKYVSPAIVEEILADPKNIELGGKKVHLTVFFSDVRGFTTISEKLDPRALSDLLNSYLTPMTELVFKNRGTLDKYMGDAVMAFFGAPIDYKDHAKYACRCALQSLSKLKELQAEYAKKGLPSIDIGIGLNTGDVSVGNMGSETVRSYTVMGDAVNLASRLEGINKEYGTRIILSEFTYAEVKDSFVCREIDWVRVKGKVLPVKIYELIAENRAPSLTQEMLKHFQDGYSKYHSKNWQKAIEAFSKCLDILPEDEVAKLYLERCQEFLAEPPGAEWDGVFVMKTK